MDINGVTTPINGFKNWVAGVITPFITLLLGVRTPFISGRCLPGKFHQEHHIIIRFLAPCGAKTNHPRYQVGIAILEELMSNPTPEAPGTPEILEKENSMKS